MQIEITSDPSELAALHSWLRSDRDLLRTADVTASAGQGGTMNAVEVINLVLTHVAAGANFALAFEAWRRTRRRPQPLTLTRPDGTKLTVDPDSPAAKEAIIEFLSK
ncbi:hypothetical protein ABZS66_47745 [Dactylosporangium sp. NPDC005572]|uniref:effector-associated constant component EACC1 n=1 Tax=Dactylosporangium sp. NPDC005572 TaxID=3156889 RepID=UPI0033A75B4C